MTNTNTTPKPTHILKISEILSPKKLSYITSIEIHTLTQIPEIITSFEQNLFPDLKIKFELTSI